MTWFSRGNRHKLVPACDSVVRRSLVGMAGANATLAPLLGLRAVTWPVVDDRLYLMDDVCRSMRQEACAATDDALVTAVCKALAACKSPNLYGCGRPRRRPCGLIPLCPSCTASTVRSLIAAVTRTLIDCSTERLDLIYSEDFTYSLLQPAAHAVRTASQYSGDNTFSDKYLVAMEGRPDAYMSCWYMGRTLSVVACRVSDAYVESLQQTFMPVSCVTRTYTPLPGLIPETGSVLTRSGCVNRISVAPEELRSNTLTRSHRTVAHACARFLRLPAKLWAQPLTVSVPAVVQPGSKKLLAPADLHVRGYTLSRCDWHVPDVYLSEVSSRSDQTKREHTGHPDLEMASYAPADYFDHARALRYCLGGGRGVRKPRYVGCLSDAGLASLFSRRKAHTWLGRSVSQLRGSYDGSYMPGRVLEPVDRSRWSVDARRKAYRAGSDVVYASVRGGGYVRIGISVPAGHSSDFDQQTCVLRRGDMSLCITPLFLQR